MLFYIHVGRTVYDDHGYHTVRELLARLPRYRRGTVPIRHLVGYCSSLKVQLRFRRSRIRFNKPGYGTPACQY
jgi:hypothetical protein